MGRVALAIALLWLTPAWAQEPAAHVQAVLRNRCGTVTHAPRDDVAYQPGKAQGGWDVASPDLPGHEPLRIDPETIGIPLDLPLKSYVGNPGFYTIPLDEVRMRIGMLSIKENQLYLDGKPLNPQSPEMQRVCEEAAPQQ